VSSESKCHFLIRGVEEEKTDIDNTSGSQSGYITSSFIICVLRVLQYVDIVKKNETK
jgi:hypothetical protein